MSRRRFSLLLFLVVPVLGTPFLARAQDPEVNWRHDYNSARKEAQDKGLPLVLDFGTKDCHWCKQLDKITFRDPRVVGTMNERFIPLKIDAELESNLAQTLHIHSYPTIVLASPDGKILGMIEGFKEAEPFQEILQRALAGVASPDWMLQDYNKAVKWVSNSEFALAISALRRIVDDGKGRPVQANAQKILNDLEGRARERLNKAKQLQDQGQTTEAIKTLTDTMRDFPGLMLTKEAGDMLAKLAQNPEIQNQQRKGRALELLAQAREYQKTKEYTLCIDRCSVLMRTYGDLSEGQEASQLYTELKNNPEWLQNACDTFGDRLAEMYLALADSLLKRGQPQQAKHWLERTIRAFPGTQQAESAQIRLEQLQGTPPTRRVDFQSPP